MPTSRPVIVSNAALRATLAAVVVAGFLAVPRGDANADAQADRIERLARATAEARDEKTRIAATVNLGRLRDPRVLRPLLGALDDESSAVRAVAAASLGHLGYAAALPRLNRATGDESELVRERARAAITAIQVRVGAKRRAARLLPRRSARQASYQIGARERPLMTETAPRLHVVVQSVHDQSSRGSRDRKRRRARYLRGLVESELGADPSVTVDHEEAAGLGLAPHGIDISIVSLDRRATSRHVEISCRLRVAISDARGRMMSFVTGGATVMVPRRTFRRDYIGYHQREAMESAVKSVQRDVVSYLTRELASR